MAKLFRTFALVLAALFALSLIVGCGGGDEDDAEVTEATLTAEPASGATIAANATVTLTFSSDPGNVTVTGGTAAGSGTSRTVTGFTAPSANLTVTWDNGPDGEQGSATLTYTVTARDTEAPTISSSTVENGQEDVDPGPLNTDGIEITFSETVTGNVALQTEAGENVGWDPKVDGDKATLTPLAGKEIGNETTYVVAGKVSDNAGNELEISIKFTTKGKE